MKSTYSLKVILSFVLNTYPQKSLNMKLPVLRYASAGTKYWLSTDLFTIKSNKFYQEFYFGLVPKLSWMLKLSSIS